MKIINLKSRVQEWLKQYGSRPDLFRTAANLRALDLDTATLDTVNEACGRPYRTFGQVTCDECGDAAETLVQLGEEPDYESSTACICLSCLKKALALMEAPTP